MSDCIVTVIAAIIIALFLCDDRSGCRDECNQCSSNRCEPLCGGCGRR